MLNPRYSARNDGHLSQVLAETRELIEQALLCCAIRYQIPSWGEKPKNHFPLRKKLNVNIGRGAAFAAMPRCSMSDSLFARSQLAIEESRQLQLQSRALQDERDLRREELRLSVLESAMQRSEFKAHRDNKK
jgi:hypothetical protein